MADLPGQPLVERLREEARPKKAGPPVHDDLVRRDFTTDGPNRLWLTDITEHRTSEGKLYLCAIKDVFSKRIVGYSIDHRMKSRLAVAALDNAVARRDNVAGCILHSDRGSQGGFNRSSQHLVIVGALDGSSTASSRSRDSS
ncbi:DDE-type integrase/transposase/recombinase, partial [Streptomyces sp. NPDC086776]|uniref:DDE-type integrase/transposase/recombinase n=1 Tax=Streptomyces sp. NPDC086776 TaxID=3365756 RepID=UPI0037F19520